MSAVGLASTKTSAVFVALAKSNFKSVISKPLGRRLEGVKEKHLEVKSSVLKMKI